MICHCKDWTNRDYGIWSGEGWVYQARQWSEAVYHSKNLHLSCLDINTFVLSYSTLFCHVWQLSLESLFFSEGRWRESKEEVVRGGISGVNMRYILSVVVSSSISYKTLDRITFVPFLKLKNEK